MLKGTNASSGIGIGNAVIVEEKELVIKREAVADTAAEVERFKGALEKTLKKTEELAADLATRVGEKEAEIMQGHMMLLMDPMLTGEIETAITGEGICAEYAIEQVCTTYADMFAAMEMIPDRVRFRQVEFIDNETAAVNLDIALILVALENGPLQ